MKYLLVINDLNDGSEKCFGPYTEKTAKQTLEKVEKFLERQRIALDEDDAISSAHLRPLEKWKPEKIISNPKRPLCPSCKEKLGVWEASWGDQIGTCKNRNCDHYQNEWELKLNPSKTRWLIKSNIE